MLSIGDLARRTGVKVPTIRYYEQIGIMEVPERSSGSQRRYDDAAHERLTFIRHARDLGLSLDAIRDLIELSHHPDRPCDRADQIVEDQLGAVRQRIARLKRLEKELTRIADGCEADAAGDCYVLRALADHDLCASEH